MGIAVPIKFANDKKGSSLFEEIAGEIAHALASIEQEEAVKEAEKRYRAIFEGASEGILVADMETRRFRYCNPAICEMLGYSEEEFIELDVTDIHPKESFDHVLTEFEAQARGDKLLTPSLPCLRKDGSVIYADVHKTSAVINGRECNVMFFTDVTKRRRMESQLRQAQKMEAIGTLAGGVAHDFNNMLSVIIGNAELAMESMLPNDPLHGTLHEIFRAAQRSADITRQLLAFARKQTTAPKVLDLNETVEVMLKMLRRLIGEDVDLSWQPAVKIWPLRIDPSQIDQVLVNLCVNARDAICDVGKITIGTGTATLNEDYCADHPGCVPGDFVVLTVSDDGCGMDQEILANLFEPFFTTKGVDKGTGLGLATVYGIVKQNQGYIDVASESGRGTTFRIYLPRYLAETESLEGKTPDKLNLDGTETILLVEDEPSILKMTRMMLERMGYKVLAAGTAGEAFAHAREYIGEIHLLITDVVMPEMNGRDLAAKLVLLYPNLKLLFMSGYTANVIAHHGVLDEGIQFIQKPFVKQNLAIKVREVLDEPK